MERWEDNFGGRGGEGGGEVRKLGGGGFLVSRGHLRGNGGGGGVGVGWEGISASFQLGGAKAFFLGELSCPVVPILFSTCLGVRVPIPLNATNKKG